MISRNLSTTARDCMTLAVFAACVACNQTTDNGEQKQSLGSGGSPNSTTTTTRASGGEDSDAGGSAAGGKPSSTQSTAKSGVGGKGGASAASSTKNAVGGTTAKDGSAKGTAGSGAGGNSAADSEPAATLIGDVEFSKPSQSFKEQIQIGMSASIAGAEIRYTVDGTIPTASSTLFSSDVTLTATTQLRAQAFVDGKPNGSVSTAIYIARTIDATSDIPIMIVDDYSKGQPCDKAVSVDAAVMIWEPVDGVASMTTLPTVAARAGMHVRGQSSVTFAQTPYKLELWDNSNKDLDYPILGMPSDSDWALIPPYYDRSLLRNPFTFSLGKDMGMEAPRNEFAEVYINLAG
ncbi:MAG TPA: CotH kinase family protein, partial [Polyangiaceae bacterium]|nr:CotH kinase family protein [Polyangiaceae bacterium]